MEQEKLVKDIADLQDVARKQREQLVKNAQEVAGLKEAITMLHDQMKTPVATWQPRSSELNELFAALAKAQGEMKFAGKEGESHSNRKHSTMEDMCNASRPALAKYGLSVKYDTDFDNDRNEFLITTLGHSSGQYISSRMYLRTEEDTVCKIFQQARGAAMTYVKRYSYSNTTGVIVSDEDEIEKQDGYGEQKQQVKPVVQQTHKAIPFK
jgi:hypothetical protein